jgi:hypothetical protein
VAYRLASHGGSIESVFAREALEHLLGHAGGSPIRINVLCHNAMLLAHAGGAHRVEIGTARKALHEFTSRASESDPPAKPARRSAYRTANRADSMQNPSASPASPAITAVSKTGMGIGVLVVCALMLGVIWLAEMRSREAPPSGGWSDAEVPSIFSEEVNASDGASWSNFRSSDGSSTDVPPPAQSATDRSAMVGKRIADDNRGTADLHRQVTISEGDSAANLKRAVPGVNLPQAVTN